jgi:hypothetical protein
MKWATFAGAASVLASVGLGVSPTVWAQDTPPTQVDLKAAYCLSVVKAMVAEEQAMATADQSNPAALQALQPAIKDWSSRLDRLQAYVQPRTLVVEPTGMLLAMKRGQVDIDTAFKDSDACAAHTGAAAEACVAKSEAIARTRTCANLDFLPF